LPRSHQLANQVANLFVIQHADKRHSRTAFRWISG